MITKTEATNVITVRLNDLIAMQRQQLVPAEKIARFEVERDAIIAKVEAAADDAFSAVTWTGNYAQMAREIGAIVGRP